MDTIATPADQLNLAPYGTVPTRKHGVELRPWDRWAGGHLVLWVTNVPTEEIVREATACRPDAAAVLADWAETWRRVEVRNGPPRSQHNENRDNSIEGYLDYCRRTISTHDDHSHVWGRYGHARASIELDDPSILGGGWRDWRLHPIDDAFVVASLRKARPLSASLRIGDETYVLTGFDDEGYPVLEDVRGIGDPWLRALVLDAGDLDHSHLYWMRKAFAGAAGRDYMLCVTPAAASLRLLAMATEGASKAFVKGVGSKTGTWTVPLAGLTSPRAAVGRLAECMLPADWPDGGVVVQEHVPFTHEQRFFVYDGRIVASVCSARQMCGLDASGRILDPRVACLVAPENERGPYDRGTTRVVEDRSLAAAFARAARRIVRDLGKEGVLSYTLDMGLTDRGILPVELNSLARSGPYCLDRDRYVETWMRRTVRRIEGAPAKLRRVVSEKDPALLSPEDVTEFCSSSEDHELLALSFELDRMLGWKSIVASMMARMRWRDGYDYETPLSDLATLAMRLVARDGRLVGWTQTMNNAENEGIVVLFVGGGSVSRKGCLHLLRMEAQNGTDGRIDARVEPVRVFPADGSPPWTDKAKSRFHVDRTEPRPLIVVGNSDISFRERGGRIQAVVGNTWTTGPDHDAGEGGMPRLLYHEDRSFDLPDDVVDLATNWSRSPRGWGTRRGLERIHETIPIAALISTDGPVEGAEIKGRILSSIARHDD